MKYLLTVTLVLFTSCQQEYPFVQAKNIEEMKCYDSENCKSSLDINGAIQPFKSIEISPKENLNSLEKVAQKHNFEIKEKTDNYILLFKDDIYFEFFFDDSKKEFLVKTQIKKDSLLGKNPKKDVELLRFDFFQKNY